MKDEKRKKKEERRKKKEKRTDEYLAKLISIVSM